jgi:hypothetical protein
MRSLPSRFSSKRLAICSLIPVLFCSMGAAGQTEPQLAVRLKKVTAFEIRPGIDVFPAFTTDGSVCRMVVEKRQYLDPRNADFDITIPSAVANQLVDELVPATERGKPSKYLSSESFVAGGASYIKQDYENVSVGMYGSSIEGKKDGANVIVISWPKRTCPQP